jgi:hypothetical protein
VLPRSWVSAVPLSTAFPQAATNIPLPLQSAFTAFTPARVYFIGGSAGNRRVGMYNYNTMSQAFVVVGTTTVLSAAWDVDVSAATMFYNPQNATLSYHVFSTSQSARVDASLLVRIMKYPYNFNNSLNMRHSFAAHFWSNWILCLSDMDATDLQSMLWSCNCGSYNNWCYHYQRHADLAM